MCALPIFHIIMSQENLIKSPLESSFQFCIKKRTTVFLIGYIFINIAKKPLPLIPQERIAAKMRQRLF